MSEQFIIFSQIVFIDLILAGDNAIVIGMVASKFPIDQRKKIIFRIRDSSRPIIVYYFTVHTGV